MKPVLPRCVADKMPIAAPWPLPAYYLSTCSVGRARLSQAGLRCDGVNPARPDPHGHLFRIVPVSMPGVTAR